VLKAAAVLYAKHALPHRLADSVEMRDYCDKIRSSTIKPPGRAAIKAAQADLADEMRLLLIDKLAAYSITSPISLAIDGWTNTRHHKVTNILCLCGGQAYYWCSVVNRYEKNTAQWLLTPISRAMKDLSESGIRITAFVADNEAVNGKLYRLLKPQYSHLLLSPCAAHTIQLCVNKTLKVHGIFEVMSQVEGVVRQFRKGPNSKQLRQQLANLQRQTLPESKVKALIIPCDTRWSSHRAAGVRLCELQKFISLCELPRPPPDEFWPQLQLLVTFLQPFQDATDIIQADNSTLYSVYQQFEKLLMYVDAIDSASPFRSAKWAVHNIIVSNWEEHVNKSAALACAWFSFDQRVRDYETTDLTATKHWFTSYAMLYAKQYYPQLIAGQSEDIILGRLEEMWGQFTGRSVGSAFAGLDGMVNRMRVAQMHANRRLVNDVWLSTWYPVTVWRNLEAEVPLFAHPAISLLSVAGSEAAVERSFSAQDSLHTKKRNRLSDRSVQNEMFIRFNVDALNGVRVDTSVFGGSCVELTDDFDIRPSTHGTVKALFRSISVAEENAAAPAAAPAPIPALSVPMQSSEQKDESKDDNSEFDSDFDEPESDSDSGSESSSDDDDDVSVQHSAEVQAEQPVSRSASIAVQVEKQLKLSSFMADVISENNWTRQTNWKGRELANVIEEAALRYDMNLTTAYLKRAIQQQVMSS
jgi:hypothetical protein